MSSARCWNCGKTGHYARNCSEMWWSRGKGKGKARGYEHADGWTWSDEHVDGLWKATDWQSSGQWMSANDESAWNAEEEAICGIEFNSIEECCSENPRRGEKQETSERDGRRRSTPAHKPSPTPKPTRSPSERSVTSEWSETSASFDDSWTRNSWRIFDDRRKEHHHEGSNVDQSCHSARSCFQETLHDECVIAIREEPNLHVEHQRETNRNWKSEVRPAVRGEWCFEDGSMRVDAQRRNQCPERFHDLIEDAV